MSRATVLIMAAGTGGHIFPALSIAKVLQEKGCKVQWLGTSEGMETKLVQHTGIQLHAVRVKGLRGKGVIGLVLAPFMILRAILQVRRVIRETDPCCVLGMGGYVTGPGGVAAWLAGKPLLIHEQNAIAGLSNRLLRRPAHRVMETFPGTFPASRKVLCTGNPVRAEIENLAAREAPAARRQSGQLNVLVLGGSRGAAAINQVIPEALAALPPVKRPAVWHQAGADKYLTTQALYEKVGLSFDEKCRLVPFIEDMAQAYEWADVVICRAGATTVSELAAVGLPSVLVPFPYAVDDHQRHNAQWLSKAGAAVLLDQTEFTPARLTELLGGFMSNTAMLQGMEEAARSLARPEAAERVASLCLEVCYGDE